jgi:hypothetical protein
MAPSPVHNFLRIGSFREEINIQVLPRCTGISHKTLLPVENCSSLNDVTEMK